MRIIYIILLYLVQPLIWLHLLLGRNKYSNVVSYKRHWMEYYGFCKNKVIPRGIWLHSVSVGETVAAIPLVRTLLCLYPSLSITVTTMTPTGYDCVISTFGRNVNHAYLPCDLPCAMNRFLDTICPKLAIIMETEIWPNMIFALHKRKIPIVLANARLSNRSTRGYRKLGRFMHILLNKITLIAAQDENDATRFIALGLERNKLAVTGNLKFDLSITPQLITNSIKLRYQWAPNRLVWVAASTHSGEETIVLQTHNQLLEYFPDLLLILVPRHPERFKSVFKMVQKSGFSVILRSSGITPSNGTQVVLGDTMGELMLIYGIADLAFIGGSLVEKGGHNPLEAAIYAIPLIMGPYTFNFDCICTKLKQANALITVTDTNSMVEEISSLLNNKNSRLFYGHNAAKVLYKNQGALNNLLELLKPFLLLQ